MKYSGAKQTVAVDNDGLTLGTLPGASKPWSCEGCSTAKCFLMGFETDGWTLEMLRGASKPWSCDGGSLAKAYPGTAKCLLIIFETDGWTLEMPKRGVGGTRALAHSIWSCSQKWM